MFATPVTRHGGCERRRIRSVKPTAPSRRHPTRQWPKVAASNRESTFPGFPELLWQTRSKVTGDPVRIVQVQYVSVVCPRFVV